MRTKFEVIIILFGLHSERFIVLAAAPKYLQILFRGFHKGRGNTLFCQRQTCRREDAITQDTLFTVRPQHNEVQRE